MNSSNSISYMTYVYLCASICIFICAFIWFHLHNLIYIGICTVCQIYVYLCVLMHLNMCSSCVSTCVHMYVFGYHLHTITTLISSLIHFSKSIMSHSWPGKPMPLTPLKLGESNLTSCPLHHWKLVKIPLMNEMLLCISSSVRHGYQLVLI